MMIKTWKEYIQNQFGNAKKFQILNLETESVEIRSTDSFISTVIEFDFAENQLDLEGVSFWGSDEFMCGYWYAPYDMNENFIPKAFQRSALPQYQGTMLEVFPFREDIVQKLEREWLDIPLNRGWIERNTLVDGMLKQSILFTKTNKGEPLELFQSNELPLSKKIKQYLKMGVEERTHNFKAML